MFRRILSLIRKEFLAIWKDPRSRMLIFAPPLMQLLIFSHAATMEVRNIHMAVLDKSNTVQSRELISGFEHSIWFKKIIKVENENQVEQLIKTKKVQMAMSINTDFATTFMKKKPTYIQIILDGRETNAASIANGYAQQIIANFERRQFPERYRGVPKINVVVRNWFNPNLIFMWYTVVSLITIIATTISLVLTSLSVAREREMGTFDQLTVSPLSSFEILVGKTVPPLILALILVTAMSLFAVFGFKVPFVGSIAIFYFATFTYILSMLGVGLFISSMCRTQQQAILGAFTFQMPAILLSGYISPIEDMPIFVQHITWLNPIRFYLVILKGIFLKGMLLTDVISNLIPLALTAILTLSLAGWMFKRNLD